MIDKQGIVRYKQIGPVTPDALRETILPLVRQLDRWGFRLIDCQVYTGHLASLGASGIARRTFTGILSRECDQPGPAGGWQFDDSPPVLSP